MYTFILAVLGLIVGYLVYGKLVDRIFKSDANKITPAITNSDGLDYVPMPQWKSFIIQLLNIAGTGPIFGAVMGAMWGPAVFLWIVLGSILGGAVHDYMSGMMSLRNNGSSVTELIGRYLGKFAKILFLPFSVLVLILVTAVFTKSAADLLSLVTNINVWVWVGIIILYFFTSSILPIDKIIGRIYPIFGFILILMVLLLIFGTSLNGYPLPELTLENQHPENLPMWPFMFITVACGAISGFHATQSPLIARCITNEKQGRHVFYGAMIAEGFIALCCAAAAIAFYGNGEGIFNAVGDLGVSGAIYNISITTCGVVGAAITFIGIAICPITSGDTALRSVRLILMDALKIDSEKKSFVLILTLIISAICFALLFIDFNVLWRYFSWSNQTIAMIVLWAASVYLLKHATKVYHCLLTFIPAMFMTAVTSTYLLVAKEGFGIDYDISFIVGLIVMLIAGISFMIYGYKSNVRNSSEN